MSDGLTGLSDGIEGLVDPVGGASVPAESDPVLAEPLDLGPSGSYPVSVPEADPIVLTPLLELEGVFPQTSYLPAWIPCCPASPSQRLNCLSPSVWSHPTAITSS